MSVESSLEISPVNDGSVHPLAALSHLAEFRFQLRSFLAFSESAAEALGITAQQYQLLQVVAQAAGEGDPLGIPGIPITQVAERMLLRHNSAVELIDRAERATLVSRATDPADQRRALIRITSRGRDVLAQLVGQHVSFLAHCGPGLIAALERVTAN